jgi:hypothetical protein
MPNSFLAHKFFPPRVPFLFYLLFGLILTSGCSGLFGTHKRVQVPPLLTPLAEADKNQLLLEVNRLAGVKSIHGKVDLIFEDNSFAEAGIAEKYKQADGTVTLQRPGEVYLVIQVPFIATDIAQMSSDGQHFRVAVLQGDEKFRRFVKGTNNATYEKLDLDGDNKETTKSDKKRVMTGKETVNTLSNLRPQHLTDALMVTAIASTAAGGSSYTQSEFYQEEQDTRPQAKKGTRVVRGYYLLEELSQTGDDVKLMRRLWFDRVGGIRLARVQTFDDRGQLITDISYFNERPFGEGGSRRLPSRIEITRPHDRYKLSINYQAPESVVLDREYRPEAFILENKWQLPEVDLDARQKTSNREDRQD